MNKNHSLFEVATGIFLLSILLFILRYTGINQQLLDYLSTVGNKAGRMTFLLVWLLTGYIFIAVIFLFSCCLFFILLKNKFNPPMRLTGFVKEHANSIKEKQFPAFGEYGKKMYLPLEKNKIEDYLNAGRPIAVSMHILKSLIPHDDSIIGALTCLTDGEWIWPNYAVYYVKQYDIKLEEEFLSKILSAGNVRYEVDERAKSKAINFLKG